MDSPALVQDPDGDYTLVSGSTWVTVGKFSVYVRKTDSDKGVTVEIFEAGDEDARDPLDSAHAMVVAGKRFVVIDHLEYRVTYPACQGCANLTFPGPLTCAFPGHDCEYPDSRKKAGPGLPLGSLS